MSNTKFLGKKLKDNPELREAFLEAYEKLVQVVDKMEEEQFEREEKEEKACTQSIILSKRS